jgi:hypothetical protein
MALHFGAIFGSHGSRQDLLNICSVFDQRMQMYVNVATLEAWIVMEAEEVFA